MDLATFPRCIRDESRCMGCGFCEDTVICPSPADCIGCLSCHRGCPYQARKLIEDERRWERIRIRVDGVLVQVPERITLKRALESLGISFGKYPGDGRIFAPCEVGGCYSCSVVVDGGARRACVTAVREGMEVETLLPEDHNPLRIIHGPGPHTVGGKGTPWWLKGDRYIEVAIWAAGCCYSCPQCQNYHVTFDGRSSPLTPVEAAEAVTLHRRRYGVDRMAISGGEPTLNRRWLVEYFKELRRLNPDPKARLHLDTNGAILTRDYLDELILDAGATDVGIEPKAVRLETFMGTTGVGDSRLAEKYLSTSWEAIRYVADNHRDKVFLGVGLPYNRALITLEEVREYGLRLASMDPDIQLCVLDYFPTFRRLDIGRPSFREMLEVKRVLEDEAGLRAVVVQTSMGHIDPRTKWRRLFRFFG